MVFRGASSINMTRLTELSRSPIPLKTASNPEKAGLRRCGDLPGAQLGLENAHGANARQQQVIQAVREKGRRGAIEIGARPVREPMAGNQMISIRNQPAWLKRCRPADAIVNFMGSSLGADAVLTGHEPPRTRPCP